MVNQAESSLYLHTGAANLGPWGAKIRFYLIFCAVSISDPESFNNYSGSEVRQFCR